MKVKVPIHQDVGLPVTWRQVAAFRLSRHHLQEHAPREALVSVVDDMAGVQAQLLSAAQLSLNERVQELQIADIDRALRERALVKAACMRQTQFLVPSDRLAVYVRGSARRAEKEIRWTRGKGVPDRMIDASIQAALAVLDKPLTRPEIAERVCHTLGVQVQSIQGEGWGSRRKVAAVPVGEILLPVVYFLHLVAARGVVCSGPYQGNEPTFVRADAWIPHWQDLPGEQAEDLLLHRYLRAFGPATPSDFALWSGMTLTDAREIWARGQSDFAPVNVEGWQAEILREDLETLAQASFEQPIIRLLPYFDTFLLGHKERDHLMAREHRLKVYRTQGWIAPVVLIDGRAVAVWEYTREGDHLSVKVIKFEAISPHILVGIQAEAENLGRFLGVPDVEIQMD